MFWVCAALKEGKAASTLPGGRLGILESSGWIISPHNETLYPLDPGSGGEGEASEVLGGPVGGTVVVCVVVTVSTGFIAGPLVTRRLVLSGRGEL